MSIPDEPIILSSEEEAEYQRQIEQLNDPYFHEWAKCGEPLEPPDPQSYPRKRRHAKFHRLYCKVHAVFVDLSGYEIGHSLGTDSRDLNKKSFG